MNKLCDFIHDSLFEYFSRTPIEEIDPLALSQFYHDYPAHASKLPCFVADRRKRYESGDDVSKITSLSAPQVLSYENPPLLLADKARVIREDGTVDSVEYGLHTFLELTGVAYRVMDADESRLSIRHIWWKPGEQPALPSGCQQIFHKAGQWGLGTEQESPEEWREISNHVVFAFNNPNNCDTKWHGDNLILIAKRRGGRGPGGYSEDFETKSGRLTLVGADLYDVSYFRHTGRWWTIATDRTLN